MVAVAHYSFLRHILFCYFVCNIQIEFLLVFLCIDAFFVLQITKQFSQGKEAESDNDSSTVGKRTQQTVLSHFMPTSRRIVQFANGERKAKPTSKIVYIDGAFDVFHVGHIAVLKV